MLSISACRYPTYGLSSRAFGPFPVLAIRGANSDMLSAQTLRMMAERHPALTALTAPDEGHAPAIEGKLIGAIIEFIRDVENARARAA